ncbi:hypothetical protein Gotri_021341 [Gossypium trilobum]|uniref:Uncharacterized protein n=1 Tax=Gossypium trilobum TaxID=34281 RepID=A0A7J9DCZ6_9ROSI|nr:hypothetical protein [Gossypium trilobum]
MVPQSAAWKLDDYHDVC